MSRWARSADQSKVTPWTISAPPVLRKPSGTLAAHECDVFKARQQQARTATARAQTRPRRRCAHRRTPGRSGVGEDSSSATSGTAWSPTDCSRRTLVRFPSGAHLVAQHFPKYVKNHGCGPRDRRARTLPARTFPRSGTNQSRGRPGSTTAFRASGTRMRPEVRLSRAACMEMPPIQCQATLDEREDTD